MNHVDAVRAVGLVQGWLLRSEARKFSWESTTVRVLSS